MNGRPSRWTGASWERMEARTDIVTRRRRRARPAARAGPPLADGSAPVRLDRRRIAIGRGRLVVDARELLACRLRLALAVPHAGVEAALASSSWCVPRSTITPWSSTMISSAPTMVDSRCAITSVVRFARHALERILDLLLGVAVERRGRLVEQQDRRRL